jgi:hypothetical protein
MLVSATAEQQSKHQFKLTIFDSSGAVWPGITVVINNWQDRSVQTYATDSNGELKLELAQGEYNVFITRDWVAPVCFHVDMNDRDISIRKKMKLLHQPDFTVKQ